MTILIAVTHRAEGRAALAAGLAEAQGLGTSAIIVNLDIEPFDSATLPIDLPGGLVERIIERHGKSDRDPANAVLDEIHADPNISRVVIGMRRRTPVGKALLGSLSQSILLDSPVPVLAVKPAANPA
ncbi:universal stress protein [Micrococcales bacterium 31B]|nr:universal stress protein [Micrococcales bacterium 31B]